jgi:hypothetical protein
MKLSLTGVKIPSIWARTRFGSSDLAYRRRKRGETE